MIKLFSHDAKRAIQRDFETVIAHSLCLEARKWYYKLIIDENLYGETEQHIMFDDKIIISFDILDSEFMPKYYGFTVYDIATGNYVHDTWGGKDADIIKAILSFAHYVKVAEKVLTSEKLRDRVNISHEFMRDYAHDKS